MYQCGAKYFFQALKEYVKICNRKNYQCFSQKHAQKIYNSAKNSLFGQLKCVNKILSTKSVPTPEKG